MEDLSARKSWMFQEADNRGAGVWPVVSTDDCSTGRGRAEVSLPWKALCLLGSAALCERGMFGLWQRTNSGVQTENWAQCVNIPSSKLQLLSSTIISESLLYSNLLIFNHDTMCCKSFDIHLLKDCHDFDFSTSATIRSKYNASAEKPANVAIYLLSANASMQHVKDSQWSFSLWNPSMLVQGHSHIAELTSELLAWLCT